MRQWQYTAINLGDLPPRTDEVMLLNSAGADGWELITITSNNIALLKRQIEDPVRPKREGDLRGPPRSCPK